MLRSRSGPGPLGAAARSAASWAANERAAHQQAAIDVECQSGSLPLASGATASAVAPDGRWSGRPESNRRRPAWEFPCVGLTKCHFLSEFITSGHPVRPGFSRFVIPSHAIWAASWAAGVGRRVMPDTTPPHGGQRGSRVFLAGFLRVGGPQRDSRSTRLLAPRSIDPARPSCGPVPVERETEGYWIRSAATWKTKLVLRDRRRPRMRAPAGFRDVVGDPYLTPNQGKEER